MSRALDDVEKTTMHMSVEKVLLAKRTVRTKSIENNKIGMFKKQQKGVTGMEWTWGTLQEAGRGQNV